MKAACWDSRDGRYTADSGCCSLPLLLISPHTHDSSSNATCPWSAVLWFSSYSSPGAFLALSSSFEGLIVSTSSPAIMLATITSSAWTPHPLYPLCHSRDGSRVLSLHSQHPLRFILSSHRDCLLDLQSCSRAD